MSDFLESQQEQHEIEAPQKAKEEKLKVAGERLEAAGKEISSFISEDTAVGDLLSLNYNEAVILVHDSLRQKVGGLPMGCFLLASRLNTGESANMDVEHEDTALIFLRVISNVSLANHADTEKYRLEAGFRAVDTHEEWDSAGKTDAFTLNQLRHAGVKCSVLGTFRMKEYGESWNLTFNADISNFYSGQGMKVYKPMGESLRKIVNYTKPTGQPHYLAGHPVHIGHVRYSSSETKSAEKIHVRINLEPTDLLARRTALFGMSRSGKSNTIKIIASSVFKLREYHEKGRIGQLIFDVNGEYCNTNPQDAGCLRNVWRETTNTSEKDVSTYGLFEHPHDKGRQMLKLNFMGYEPKSWNNKDDVINAMAPLLAGKEIINQHLINESSGYVKTFRDTSLHVPLDDWTPDIVTRYRRCITAYRSLLTAAGFATKSGTTAIKGLFSKELRQSFVSEYPQSAAILGQDTAAWVQLQGVFQELLKFFNNEKFKQFEKDRIAQKIALAKNKDAFIKPWADDMLKGMLALIEYPAGLRRLLQVKEQHSPDNDDDYSVKIVQDLRNGKLVIVDGSIGSEEMIKHTSERIMWELFSAQKHDFVSPDITQNGDVVPPPDVVVYIEEAHNLLPQNGKLTEVWPRIAKEGSKFHIGMVYSTQEPSSIMSNILKNTDNWFVAHLNNKDEVKELDKYYDFGEFVKQILKVPDTGFLRMRCLSNPYVVPVQVAEFKAPISKGNE